MSEEKEMTGSFEGNKGKLFINGKEFGEITDFRMPSVGPVNIGEATVSVKVKLEWGNIIKTWVFRKVIWPLLSARIK